MFKVYSFFVACILMVVYAVYDMTKLIKSYQ